MKLRLTMVLVSHNRMNITVKTEQKPVLLNRIRPETASIRQEVAKVAKQLFQNQDTTVSL